MRLPNSQGVGGSCAVSCKIVLSRTKPSKGSVVRHSKISPPMTLWVNHVRRTHPTSSRDVRFTSNCVPTLAQQQIDAECHLLTCCRMLIDVQSGAKLDGTGDC